MRFGGRTTEATLGTGEQTFGIGDCLIERKVDRRKKHARTDREPRTAGRPEGRVARKLIGLTQTLCSERVGHGSDKPHGIGRVAEQNHIIAPEDQRAERKHQRFGSVGLRLSRFFAKTAGVQFSRGEITQPGFEAITERSGHCKFCGRLQRLAHRSHPVAPRILSMLACRLALFIGFKLPADIIAVHGNHCPTIAVPHGRSRSAGFLRLIFIVLVATERLEEAECLSLQWFRHPLMLF